MASTEDDLFASDRRRRRPRRSGAARGAAVARDGPRRRRRVRPDARALPDGPRRSSRPSARTSRRFDVFEAAAFGDLDRLSELLAARSRARRRHAAATASRRCTSRRSSDRPTRCGCCWRAARPATSEGTGWMTGTPLSAAAAGGHTAIVLDAARGGRRSERAAGAGVHAAARGRAERRTCEAVEALLDAGADPAIVTEDGVTAARARRAGRRPRDGRDVARRARLRQIRPRRRTRTDTPAISESQGLPRPYRIDTVGDVGDAPEGRDGRAALGLVAAERVGRLLVIRQEPVEHVHRDRAGGRGREELGGPRVADAPRAPRTRGRPRRRASTRRRSGSCGRGGPSASAEVTSAAVAEPSTLATPPRASTSTLLYEDARSGCKRDVDHALRACAPAASPGPGSREGCRPVRRWGSARCPVRLSPASFQPTLIQIPLPIVRIVGSSSHVRSIAIRSCW